MDSMKDFENADTVSIDTLALENILHDEREKEINELNSLSEKVYFLHTNLLYYRNTKKIGSTCYEAWKILVKKIGGSPNTWRDLGFALGISQVDIDYIANTMAMKDDPANIILKVYMQDEKATIDKIINALIKLKRYDILKAVEEPLCNLAQSFEDDSGYQSNSSSTGKREIISLKSIPNDLPPALTKKYDKNTDKPKQPSLRPSVKQEGDKKVTVNPTLFLTYTEDGLETATNIQHYVNNWDDLPAVTVLTLNSRREEVVQNPEKFIREYFEKAHFIVPIITTGYLNRIKSYTPQAPSTDDNLDFKYVNFIYNLIVNYYIHASGCLNEKVRSVLPQNVNVDVLRDISMYPDLLPWTYETNFDEHFKAFLKNLLTPDI